MTAISFSVFKNKLLNGSKAQTIRLHRSFFADNECEAYKIRDKTHYRLKIKVGTPLQVYWKQRSKKVYLCNDCDTIVYGEDVVPAWGSKEGEFKIHCDLMSHNVEQTDGSEKLFDAVCTETFLIKMWKQGIDEIGMTIFGDEAYKIVVLNAAFDRPHGSNSWIEDLAKCDGFVNDFTKQKSGCCDDFIEPLSNGKGGYCINCENAWKNQTAAQSMFEWFDKHHDLTVPKMFQVIRWKKK